MESIASFVNHTTSSLHASQLLPSLPPPSSTTTVLLLSPLPTHQSPNHSPHLSPTTSPISSLHLPLSIYHSFHSIILPIPDAHPQVPLDVMITVIPCYIFPSLSPLDSNPNIRYQDQKNSPRPPPLHCNLPLPHHPPFCFPQCIVWNEGGLMEGRGREGT